MGKPVYIIAAVAENGIIGRDGEMPWRLATDLKRFKALTIGKPIVMGRKTWVSLGHPLPSRTNIIVTRDQGFSAEGAVIAYSLTEALRIARAEAENTGADCVFIIGGGEIYRESLPMAKRIYLTEVQAEIKGDAYFPDFDRMQWQTILVENVPAGEKDSYATRFVIYERLNYS